MADGKWVMTEEDSKRVDLTYSGCSRNAPSADRKISRPASAGSEKASAINRSNADPVAERQISCTGMKQGSILNKR